MHSISGKSIGLPLVTTIGIVRDHAAQRITWHSHKGFEILFLLDGATAYEFKDGRSVEVPGGHFLVVPPRAVHRGVHDVRMPATICGIVLNPQPGKQWKNTPFDGPDLRWIVEQFKRFQWTVHPFNWDLRRLVTRLVGFQKNSGAKPNPLSHATARWMACAAIAEAAQQMIAQKSSPPTVLIAAATAFLREKYHEQIQMPDLVRRLGFGRARVFQLFKEGMGLSPNDYLQRVRVEKAQELLRDTQKSITDIAMQTGFNSSQYFSTVFRRYTGYAPALYRERFSQPA